MRAAHRRQSRRGFALVAAIGVLAVLMVFAIAAAGTAEFTRSFSSARQHDRRLSTAIEEAATLVALQPLETFERGESASSSGGITLIPPRPTSDRDIVVSATLGVAPQPGQLGSALALREGDRLVSLEAARADGRGQRRTSLFLINTAGHRRVPILLQETRL